MEVAISGVLCVNEENSLKNQLQHVNITGYTYIGEGSYFKVGGGARFEVKVYQM